MILYMSSFQNSDVIAQVVQDSNEIILDSVIEARLSLNNFVKQKLDQFQNVNIFVLDISMLKDDSDEILTALNNLRMVYDNLRIVIIALDYEVGNPFLSEIFNRGIYNIITDEKNLDIELMNCIKNGMSYKDSLRYKMESETTESRPKKKEIIVKSEFIQATNKTLIGFTGARDRSGVSHQVIASANLLKNKGFQVAVLEYNPVPILYSIQEYYEENRVGLCYTHNNVDYYPEFDMKNMNQIYYKNYNFILIDFGVFRKQIIEELNRCVMQIVISCSRPWEISSMNQIFEVISPEILKEYYYAFNFTDSDTAQVIRESMEPFEKIFFLDYIPDPFNPKESEGLKKLFCEYIKDSSSNVPSKNVLSFLFPKIPSFKKPKGDK